MRTARAMLTIGAMAVAASVAAGAGGAAPRGLYSPAQAAQGAALYAERCAMCHGKALEGTFEVPGLTGKFVAHWGGRPVGDLTAYVGRAMPQFAPGSLAPDETARIVAYLLQANGYPPGADPVPATPIDLQVLPPPPRPH